MEDAQNRPTGRYRCLGLIACLILAGCPQIPKDAIRAEVDAEVKATIASPEFKASIHKTVMESTTQTGRINIGSIAVSSSIWIWAVLFLLALVFWWRGRRATKTTDVLIGQLEQYGMTKGLKQTISHAALFAKVLPFLKRRLRKVRKRMKKENEHEND